MFKSTFAFFAGFMVPASVAFGVSVAQPAKAWEIRESWIPPVGVHEPTILGPGRFGKQIYLIP